MMTMDDLIAALNDPTSDSRQRLLHNLAMSPLDPAAAFAQVKQGAGQGDAGGMPMPQTPQGPGMSDLLSGQVAPQMSLKPMEPGVNAGGKGPWSFDYAGPNNAAPMTDPNNPNFVPPAAAAATSLNPSASLVPGETGGMPDAGAGGIDLAAMKKMLEGTGELNPQQRPQQFAPAPSLTNNWRGFQAQQLQTPGATGHMSLSQLLYGR